MQLDQATIKLEIGDDSATFDVVDIQLKIEEIQRQHGDNDRLIIESIQEMFHGVTGISLSVSATWSLITVVREAFEDHKKKLASTCELAFGSIPIHLQEVNAN